MRYAPWRLWILLTIVAVPTWTGCNDRSTLATPIAPTPTPASSATVTRITLSGTVALTSIGETSQLTATATLSDNTTKNVSSEGRWLSLDPRVVTISPAGLLTVLGFGSSFIAFTYQTRGDGTTVTVTPAGTFVISGRVREPGLSSLADVRVTDTASGRSTTSNQDGQFSIADLARAQMRFRFTKDGYEPTELDATGVVDMPLQRVIRLVAGETAIPPALAPNDLSYDVGNDRCYPCRLIRVMVPSAGTVALRVTWNVPTARINLFAEGQVFTGENRLLTAEVPIGTAREVVMYLGGASPNSITVHTPFSIETALR